MSQLALRASLVAGRALVAARGQVGEAQRELAVASLSRRRGPPKGPIRVEVVAAPQVRLADEERSLKRVGCGGALLYPGLSHEKPTGRTGGSSGLAGRPGRGSLSL